jgi:hypothetical protein
MSEPISGPDLFTLRAAIARVEQYGGVRGDRPLILRQAPALLADRDRLAEQLKAIKDLTHDSDGNLLPPEVELPVGVFYGVLYGAEPGGQAPPGDPGPTRQETHDEH